MSSSCLTVPLGAGGKQSFNFDYLWSQALLLNKSDPRDQCIYHPLDDQSRLTLTYDACLHYFDSGWANFPREDVYNRVLLWFVPLFVLWATTTLPALGNWRKCFTLVHMLADPIDTVYSLFYKLDLATRQFKWAESNETLFTFVGPNSTSGATLKRRSTSILDPDMIEIKAQDLRRQKNTQMRHFDLDAIALIVNAYQEWHLGDEARRFMESAFDDRRPIEIREAIRQRCETAAAYIAADRVSRFLPSVIATIVFFLQMTAAFWKTLDGLGDSYDSSNTISVLLNLTPQNLAFGTLYFWLPFAVLTTAFVGSANTTNSVPRILRNLRGDVEDEFETFFERRERSPGPGPSSQALSEARDVRIEDIIRPVSSVISVQSDASKPLLSDLQTPKLPQLRHNMKRRWAQGGLPTWQPDKFNDWTANEKPKFVVSSLMLSILVVLVPTVATSWMSWRTPTDGFGCKSIAQIGFFVAWLINHVFDWVLCCVIPRAMERYSRTPGSMIVSTHGGMSQKYFWLTFVKDTLFVGGAIATLTLISIGMFNSCNCWSQMLPDHNQRYISFPQEQFVFNTIKYRIEWEFSFLVLGVFVFELAFFGVVAWKFWSGYRVLKQYDIETIFMKASKSRGTSTSEQDPGPTLSSSRRGLTVTIEEGIGSGTASPSSRNQAGSIRQRQSENITQENRAKANEYEMDQIDQVQSPVQEDLR